MKKLYWANIFHKRLYPVINEFNYTGFYIKFSLQEMHNLQSRFFGVNRFNIFSFYEKDHGKRDGSCLKTWCQNILKQANIAEEFDDIVLHTFPRVMGHVFNPVSFWYCYKDGSIKAIICEVNNTFKENHNYVLSYNEGVTKKMLSKEFHVSPFYDVNGNYEFDFKELDNILINYYFDNKLQFLTSLKGDEIKWNARNFGKIFLRFPLYSFMVLFLIHYQALRLFIKKCKFYSKPEKIQSEVTYENSNI